MKNGELRNTNDKLTHTKLKKEQKAITLIALVITIIVLLILAGVAIGQLTKNGLFENAKKAKIEQMRAEAKENINLAIMQIQISESEKGNSVNLKILHEQLPIVDKRIDVEEYTEGDTTLNIVYSDKGMSFEVTVDSFFNIIVSETPADGNSKFDITVDEITASGLRVTGNESDLSKIDYSEFTYVAQTSNSNQIKVEHITETSYIFTGLEQETTYTVYMIAIDNAGNERISLKKTVTTDKVPGGTETGAITFSDAIWENGKASVLISTTKSNYYIEYQLNGTTSNWTKATTLGESITVSNLNHNDIVYARLTDGTVSGSYANVTIVDVTAPNVSVKFSESSAKPGGKISTTINITDSESGVNINNCKWVFSSNNNDIGIDENDYSGGTFTSSSDTFELTVPSEYGTYYLHILSVDYAENKKETISSKLDVTDLVFGNINYEAGGETEWSLLYQEEDLSSPNYGNIYLITSDIIKAENALKSTADLESSGTYWVNFKSSVSRKEIDADVESRFYVSLNRDKILENYSAIKLFSQLLNYDTWQVFNNGKSGNLQLSNCKAIGAPTIQLVTKSIYKKYKGKYNYTYSIIDNALDCINDSTYIDFPTEIQNDKLYFPNYQRTLEDGTKWYCVASINFYYQIGYIKETGYWFGEGSNSSITGLRPVVCIPNTYKLQLNSETGKYDIVQK